MKNKTFKRVKNMIKPYTKTVILVSILALIIDVIALIKPYIVKVVINELMSKGIDSNGIVSFFSMGLIYILLIILENILNYIDMKKTNEFGESVVFDLRNKLFEHIEKCNITFHDKVPSGKLFVRIISDIEDIYALFSEVVTTFAKDVIVLVGIVIIMIYISYKLALLSFIVIPFIIITSLVFTKLLNKTYSIAKNARTKLNTFFAESIYGLRVIKIFNRQYEKQKECNELTNAYKKSARPIGYLQGFLNASMTIIENVGISIIVWATVLKITGTNIDIGLLYVFITYLKSMFDPINRMIENVDIVEEATTSIDKVYEILEDDAHLEDYDSGKELEKMHGKIEFKNVWFAYEAENWVLKDVSFTIEAGQSVALVGKTGSGKTTITNLINRFYEPQKGEILIDGINIKNIKIESLRKNIGTILQDPFIYAKTIKENVQLFNNMSDKQIEEAVELASASDFASKQPLGLDTVASERGISFSAGQKQLLAFSRIFALNPSIFILDEATANIDTTTEELIQSSIDRLSQDKTSIFIAHRLATIVNVDNIIVLDKGTIIEQGSHNELVRSGGYYSDLYKAYYNSLV